MPVALGVVAIGASVAGSIMGANAAQGIATSEAAQAAQTKAQAMAVAAPTTQELANISDRISQQTQYNAINAAAVQRDENVLNSIDPSLVTAGQTANSLMQGQSAAILAPMKQQQALQRSQLQQQLAAQLGPGYATSSVGQQALQQFDMSSNLQLQQAQMQTLQGVTQYLGYGSSAASQIQSQERLGFETGSQMSAQTASIMSNIQTRQVGAIEGTAGNMQATAGSQYAGAAGLAKGVSGLGASIGQLGGFLGGSAAPTQGQGGSGQVNPIAPQTPGSANYVSPLGGGNWSFA